MSHSCIFKVNPEYLTTEYEEICEDEYCDNGFIDGYHDYVSSQDEEENKDNYNWLLNASSKVFENLRLDNDGHYLIDVNKNKALEYIKAKVESGISHAKNIVTIVDGKIKIDGTERWRTERAFSGDVSAFYFEINGCYYTELHFLFELIEYYTKDSDKITLRLEGTLDYHC